MAKRRSTRGTGLMRQVGFEPITPQLRHVNSQTFGANATTEIGEAINNPGYSDVSNVADHRTGIFLESVHVMGDANIIIFGQGTGAQIGLNSQIQVGDRTGTPASLHCNSPWLVAALTWHRFISTSGGCENVWPLPMFMLRRPPIVVVPEFSICHWGENNTAFNNLNIHTIIFYRVVKMTDQLFSTLLQDQQRTS